MSYSEDLILRTEETTKSYEQQTKAEAFANLRKSLTLPERLELNDFNTRVGEILREAELETFESVDFFKGKDEVLDAAKELQLDRGSYAERAVHAAILEQIDHDARKTLDRISQSPTERKEVSNHLQSSALATIDRTMAERSSGLSISRQYVISDAYFGTLQNGLTSTRAKGFIDQFPLDLYRKYTGIENILVKKENE